VARQEQDFNQETSRQLTTIVIKDSTDVLIDLTESQIAQVFQLLQAHYEQRDRPRPADSPADDVPGRRILAPRAPRGELQDVEVNTLEQRQFIQIENCSSVRITVSQVAVEKVMEIALELIRRRERPDPGKST
jgi:hypothetical protein